MVEATQDPAKKENPSHTQDGAPDLSLTPKTQKVMEDLASQYAKARDGLLKDYQKIDADIIAKKETSGSTFTDIEAASNQIVLDADKKAKSDLSISPDEKLLKDEKIRHAYEQMEEKLFQGSPAVPTTQWVDIAFTEKYLLHPKYKEEIDVPIADKTEQGLIAALLAHNRGFAVGDQHNQEESYAFLAKHMATLKANGVDTVYAESDVGKPEFSDLSVDELKQLARDKKYKAIELETPEKRAEFYQVAKSDDNVAMQILMLAAAKENNIRVVSMDADNEVEYFLISGAQELKIEKKPLDIAQQMKVSAVLDYRVARTNFVWTDIIEKDRQSLGRTGGKFVVIGGEKHFDNSKTIDEALGIPLLAYESADKLTSPAFRKNESNHGKDGPDFLLPGGLDYDGNALIPLPEIPQTLPKLEPQPYTISPQKIPAQEVQQKKEDASTNWGMIALITAAVVAVGALIWKLFSGNKEEEQQSAQQSYNGGAPMPIIVPGGLPFQSPGKGYSRQ